MLLLKVASLSFFCSSFFLFADFSEDVFLRRVNAHLLIEDKFSALQESKEAIQAYPSSLTLLEAHIFALAKIGDEKEMLLAWQEYNRRVPTALENKELIEEMAWGVLNKVSKTSSLPVKQMSLLAAFFSQDQRGITILQQGMRDSNYAIRAYSVKFAGHLRDQKLIDEVKKLFLEERNHIVRLEVIKAIGSMKIRSLEKKLKELIASNESCTSEKKAAITSLIEIWDGISRSEIELLVKSNRSGLRSLAAEAIAYFQSARDVDLLIDLTSDPHPEVRVAAFYSLGQISPENKAEEIITIARQAVKERNKDSSICAAWLLTLYEKEEGFDALREAIRKKEWMENAIAALNHTGKNGIALTVEVFKASSEPLTKLNLAMGLIRQQVYLELALPFIREFLLTSKEKLSQRKEGFFDGFCFFSHEKADDFLMTPELENQLTRLELLGILASYNDSYAQEAIKHYLLERSWGISAAASALLLTEGDDECVPIVEQLLGDNNATIRLQAALLLSLFTKEESIIKILEGEYKDGDWEMKLKILESLGRIGSSSSLSFLISKLGEERQTLRLIAAVAIIQTVNH